MVNRLAPFALLTLLTYIPSMSMAASPNATCQLSIDGKTRMTGKCSFNASADGIDSFSDGKLLIVCPNGKPIATTRCQGASQTVARRGSFGILYRGASINAPEDKANICWNEGYMRKAESCFDGLSRQGACWVSNAAKERHGSQRHEVKFCAYSL